MTHSRLKGDYQTLVEFVRASGVNTGKHQKLKPTTYETLDGHKVRKFYENVISSNYEACKTEVPLKIHRKKHHVPEGQCLEKRITKSFNRDLSKDNSDKIRKTTSRLSKSSCSRSAAACESVTGYEDVTGYGDIPKHIEGYDALDTVHRRGLNLLKHAQEGDTEQVKTCLQNGVAVDFQDQFGWTALMCASVSGQPDTVQFLLEQHADMFIRDARGKMAKDLAKQNGQQLVVELFEQVNLSCIASPSLSKETNIDVCNKFYCTVCKQEFYDTNQRQHQTSTVHLFNMKLKPKSDTYLIPESNVGYKMMLKGGWNADRGLGPDGSGNKFPIKTILKRDRKGLGAKQKVSAKVTHFNPHDKNATKSVKRAAERKVSLRTLSKRAMLLKEKRDKNWEIQLRRYMNSD